MELMTKKKVETALPLSADRHFSPRAAGPFAKSLEDSGVVDYFQTWDQLTSWWPRDLWREDTTPMYSTLPDCDSFQDPFVAGTFGLAATEELGIAVSTDAIRNGPAELLQTMLTLADATAGKAVLMLGAGEVKQAGPFGYKRSEGLARMEDLLRIFRLLLNTDGPIDFDGKFWKYKQAWIGEAKANQPKVYSMGGGERLINLAAECADGFVSITPFAFHTPEQYAAEVDKVKVALDKAGRDPEDFTFGLWHNVLLFDESEDRDAVLDNPLLRFIAAVFGRFKQSDWLAEGFQPVFPEDWHYALKLLPVEMSREEADRIVEATPRTMVEKTFICGTPEEVMPGLQEYVEAGASFVSLIDMSPCARPAEEAESAHERQLEVCRLLKAT